MESLGILKQRKELRTYILRQSINMKYSAEELFFVVRINTKQGK